MATFEKYKIVPVGEHQSIHFSEYGETMHPGLGPAGEAEALYVQQLRLPQRIAQHKDDFIIWDIGLGAAANALTVLKALRNIPSRLKLVSFDYTLEPLRFALQESAQLGYFFHYEEAVENLLKEANQSSQSEFGTLSLAQIEFQNSRQTVVWEVHVGDFPALMQNVKRSWPAPHAILFDPFSPKKNPAMWTRQIFADVFRQLDPQRPCSLATYSRSSMTRVSLLNAGFFVGIGEASGEKEETTIAANTLDLIEKPLDLHWLARARRSHSAEPLAEAMYRQAPISYETWEKLKRHSQFS